MSRRRRVIAPALTLALALAAALLLGGCGSGSLSVPALHKRATKICKLATMRANAIPSPTSTGGGERFLQRSEKVLRPELAALQRLKARGDAEPVYRRAVAALSGELTAISGAAKTIGGASDPVAAIRTLQATLDPLERRAATAWHTLGIPACEAT